MKLDELGPFVSMDQVKDLTKKFRMVLLDLASIAPGPFEKEGDHYWFARSKHDPEVKMKVGEPYWSTLGMYMVTLIVTGYDDGRDKDAASRDLIKNFENFVVKNELHLDKAVRKNLHGTITRLHAVMDLNQYIERQK